MALNRKKPVTAPAPKLQDLIDELDAEADRERAKSSAWFFKTGKGEYGEGDQFLGIRVPIQRKIAHRYVQLPLLDIERLLKSPIHEHRFTAAEILVARYESAAESERKTVFEFYLRNARRLNNWDLVDTSAPYIVGAHLLQRPRDALLSLTKSSSVWERRIAIVSTFAFLKQGEMEDTFQLSELLLDDAHELIHKAVGWALRETGKVSRDRLLRFLKEHYEHLPRTTLRYAIEHLPENQRKLVLRGDFDWTS